MSNKNGDIFAAFVGLIAGAGMFYAGFRARQRYKIIERTPTSKVRSMAVGLVEVSGKVESAEILYQSPFAQAECVYYSYKVEERRRSGKSHKWVTIEQGETDSPFYLRDETGRVLVDPRGADCSLDTDHSYTMETFTSSAQEVRFKAGLERIGISSTSFFFERPLRATEIYISPGDSLFILGCATPRQQHGGSASNAENLVIGKGAEWFSISERSEREMLSSLWWQMYGMIFGGPVLTVGCLWYLLHRFHVE